MHNTTTGKGVTSGGYFHGLSRFWLVLGLYRMDKKNVRKKYTLDPPPRFSLERVGIFWVFFRENHSNGSLDPKNRGTSIFYACFFSFSIGKEKIIEFHLYGLGGIKNTFYRVRCPFFYFSFLIQIII